MKYRDDEYEYESRRREMEQRRRMRPDAEMTSQRRRNPAGSGQTASSGTRSTAGARSTSGAYRARGAADPYGTRRAAGSGAGTRSTAGTARSASGVRSGTRGSAGSRTSASARRVGADPYDRSYQAGYYGETGRRSGQTASRDTGRTGKKALSSRAKKKRRVRKILFAVEGILLLVVLAGLFVISKWDLIQKATFGKKDVHINELSENTIQSMEGFRTIAIFGADEEGSHSDVKSP